MIPKLIILEGADNCGKTTLATAIAKYYRAVYWRLTAGPGLCEHQAMSLYQSNALDNAEVNIANGLPVVIDRHWPSDAVYGPVLRDGPSTDLKRMEKRCAKMDAVYIYCYRDNATKEHAKSKDPDHPYADDVYDQVLEGYEELFTDLAQRRTVISYYLNNFIDRPGQMNAFIEGLRHL